MINWFKLHLIWMRNHEGYLLEKSMLSLAILVTPTILRYVDSTLLQPVFSNSQWQIFYNVYRFISLPLFLIIFFIFLFCGIPLYLRTMKAIWKMDK